MRSCRPKSALPQHLLEYLTLLQRQTQEHAPIVRLALAHSYVEQAQGKRHTEVATVGYTVILTLVGYTLMQGRGERGR